MKVGALGTISLVPDH